MVTARRRMLGSFVTRGALLVAILLVSCGPPPTPEEQAIQVAYGEARSRFHYSQDIRNLPPRVDDLGDRWRIYFQPPPGYTGGDPVVDVRKSDISVVDSGSGQ
jgi:hypothetical protein